MKNERSGSIETGHHITALLIAKPRTVASLVHLVECCRTCASRHLQVLMQFGLVDRERQFPLAGCAGPFIYTWKPK
jgi:predicted transcriptional regulator